jgi:hypothetical protein
MICCCFAVSRLPTRVRVCLRACVAAPVFACVPLRPCERLYVRARVHQYRAVLACLRVCARAHAFARACARSFVHGRT